MIPEVLETGGPSGPSSKRRMKTASSTRSKQTKRRGTATANCQIVFASTVCMGIDLLSLCQPATIVGTARWHVSELVSAVSCYTQAQQERWFTGFCTNKKPISARVRVITCLARACTSKLWFSIACAYPPVCAQDFAARHDSDGEAQTISLNVCKISLRVCRSCDLPGADFRRYEV